MDGLPSEHGLPPIVYSDLIFDTLDVIHSVASTLLGNEAFAGNQPDDFALAGRVTPSPKRLLMGIGLGGVIPPILNANPSASLTCVDLPESLRLRDTLHQEYFLRVSFATSVVASQSPSRLKGEFDALHIDGYDSAGYPGFTTDDYFWAAGASLFTAVHRSVGRIC